MEQYIAEFVAAMKDRGIETLAQIVGDGRLHRFHITGDKAGTLNGWYVLHIDERPAGSFGRWGDEKQTWTAQGNKKLTAGERRALEKRITEQRRLKEAEEKRLQEEAAQRAASIWDQASPAPAAHDYLKKKGIKGHMARESRGDLVIPMQTVDGVIRSLQFISFAGEKRYLTDGRKKGCFAVLERPGPRPDELTICVCEGFATGASIHEATGHMVAIAFDAGNLEAVAVSLRVKHPRAILIICADNDCWKPEKGNAGVEKGTAAAKAARARLAVPQFLVGEGKPTDFNDLHAREGLEKVRAQVAAAKDLAPAEVVPAESGKAKPNSDRVGGGVRYPINVEWPFTHGKDAKPTACVENVKALIDFCGIDVAYNVIRKDLEITVPNSSFLIDTARNDKMTLIISLASIAKLPTSSIPEFVSFLGGQNPFNPVGNWILSKPWDQEDRLPMFFATVLAAGEDGEGEEAARIKATKELLMRRWMISAVAAAMEPSGTSTGGVLVFQGDQYSGKTQWFKSLVPRELELTMDGAILRPEDKDSVFQVVTKWLVELGEVDATFRKSDIAQLKAFLTKDRDMLRRPYARTESEFARRTVFFASVNPKDYLADPTGNRRFWTIPCAKIHWNHGLEMQQIWAQFYELYRAGEPWRLTPDEVQRLNEHNKEFEVSDPMEERLRDGLNWDLKDEFWSAKTATGIAQAIGISNPTAKDLKGVAKAVREITGKEAYKSNGRLVYRVPPRKGD